MLSKRFVRACAAAATAGAALVVPGVASAAPAGAALGAAPGASPGASPGAVAAAPSAAPSAAAASARAPTACAANLQHTFLRLQDEKPQPLCQYRGKVLLVVNTASFCGFTPQYQGLEALHAKYQGRGLVVLGFPSNDFSQESGSNKDVADFCESTFGVKFPMFVKSSVRGEQANPLFRQLAAQTGTTPKWNFYKYLIGRDGQAVASYGSLTAPDDAGLVRALEAQLQKPAP